MPPTRPLVLLVAAHDRAAIVAELAACRAVPAEQLASRATGPLLGRERFAIVTDPSVVHDALDLAIARLPTFTGRRWVARAQGASFTVDAVPGRIAFVFPGQGSQHPGMLGDLRARLPMVSRWFDALDAASVEAGRPLPSLLLNPAGSPEELGDRHRALHDMERGAQLGAAAELALFDVLAALGVTADVHVGHSNGEHAAVIAAGRVHADVEALCRSFVRLGEAGSRLPKLARPEGLLAVSAVRRERLAAILANRGGSLSLAMDNCPTQAVVGGERSELSALADALVSAGGVAAPLPFSRAYHTPLFADWQATLAAYYREWPMQAGRVPVHSCLTTGPLPDDDEECRATMAAQWTRCIHFGATVARLHDEGVRTFVEVGPGATLTAFVDDVLRARPHVAVSTSSSARGDIAQLCHLVADLFLAGLPMDPERLWRLIEDAPVAVPTTAPSPWLAAADVHRRLIADARTRMARMAATFAPVRPAGPLLDEVSIDPTPGLRARRRFTRAADGFVDHHALGRPAAAHRAGGYPLPVLPFTLSLELAAEAARALTGTPVREIHDVRASQWLALDLGQLRVDVTATASSAGVQVQLVNHDRPAPGAAFEATVAASGSAPPPVVDATVEGRAPRRWTARTFYERYAFHGPAFQGLTEVRAVGPRGIDADVVVTAIDALPPDALVLDPALLDCAGQLVAFWLLEHGDREPTFGIFPVAARRVVVGRTPLPRGTRLRARVEATLFGTDTDATCVFESLDGEFVLAIEGFRQRLMPFPGALARTIFGGEPANGDALRAIDPAIFTTSWNIWERALAHLALAPDDLARWHAMPATHRTRWLLDRL